MAINITLLLIYRIPLMAINITLLLIYRIPPMAINVTLLLIYRTDLTYIIQMCLGDLATTQILSRFHLNISTFWKKVVLTCLGYPF